MFDDVDVNTQIEARVDGQAIVQSLVIRSANHKSVAALTQEIRARSDRTRLQPREILDLTTSVDHQIVDGAQAARFARR